METASTTCTVEITAPSGIKTTFRSDTPDSDLLGVRVEKDLSSICGTFTLTFAPRLEDGLTWADRIPMRSLVTIKMERLGAADMPEMDDPTVMVGITDNHATSESYQSAQLRREVQVSGREISCILLDANLWYHPKLQGKGGGVLSDTEAALNTQQLAIVWNPDLIKNGVDPRDNLKRILEYFIFGGDLTTAQNATEQSQTRRKEAVINLQIPGKSLRTILKMYEAWTTFDEVTIPIAQNSAFMGTILNYCLLNVDPAFQEFFTRIEDGASVIHFRGKPFQQESVTTGTRFAEVETCQTLYLHDSWILGQQLTRSSNDVYNVFWVYPMGTWNFLEHTHFNHLALPKVLNADGHPSNMKRYGLRVMKVASPYLPYMHQTSSQRGGTSSSTSSTSSTTTSSTASSTSARIPTESLSKSKAALATQAATIAAEQGVPASMIPTFLANTEVESNWNPHAVSPAGAQGLGQLMPATATRYGVTDSFDVTQNLTGSAKYWRDLCKMFGNDTSLVPAAYNAGEGAVKRYNGVPPFKETKNHVARVNARTGKYSNSTPVSVQSKAAPTSSTSANDPAPLPPGHIAELAEKWSGILQAWYEHAPLLHLGRFSVRGHPIWNIGHRLLLEDEGREFYIEGVSHTYDFRTGRYVTDLRVTRGWYLDNRIDAADPNAITEK